jgi:Zn-dependent peptidase ImmA (M78 family)
MNHYKNQSLKKISNLYPSLDFSNLEGIFVFPVGELCDMLKINVEFTKLDKGKSGFYDCNSQTIFVNDNYPATRNLFTIAHEIGHFILHQGSQNRFDEYHKYTEEELAREKVANNFAGELLMPQYKFKEAFDEVRGDIKKLADRFGVSIRAIEIRSFRLGLIDNI